MLQRLQRVGLEKGRHSHRERPDGRRRNRKNMEEIRGTDRAGPSRHQTHSRRQMQGSRSSRRGKEEGARNNSTTKERDTRESKGAKTEKARERKRKRGNKGRNIQDKGRARGNSGNTRRSESNHGRRSHRERQGRRTVAAMEATISRRDAKAGRRTWGKRRKKSGQDGVERDHRPTERSNKLDQRVGNGRESGDSTEERGRCERGMGERVVLGMEVEVPK